MRITMDFETRSAVDIRQTGAWIYSIDPSTDPLCLCYTLEETDEPKVWVPEWVWDLLSCFAPYEYADAIAHVEAIPSDLKQAILEGAEIEAHNAFFERAIWENIMVPRFGWPHIKREQWRCSAAKAAACALPRSLEGATSALGVLAKDTAGKAVMMRVCKPRKVLKAERKEFKELGWTERKDYGWDVPGESQPQYYWREGPDDLHTTIEYCRQDVRAERALSQELPDLHPREQTVWQVDQDINFRGVHIDIEMAKSAIELSDTVIKQATGAAREASGGAFTTLGQRDKILGWLRSQGLQIGDLQAATVKDLLKSEIPDNVHTVLESKKICSKSSIKKYQKMVLTADPRDDRVRDFLKYHGASTGRWTGKHIQTQNLPRGKMKDPDTMCAIIRDGDLEFLNFLHAPTPPTSILSWAIRGAICAPEGLELICADYSGVEARGLLWFMEDKDGLEVFNRSKGEPGIYREMAGAIYGVDPKSIDKGDLKGAEMRQMGKRAILGLGYGMGAPKFQSTCLSYGMNVDVDFAKHVVDTYRGRFPKVPAGWRKVEAAAVNAVKNPGVPYRVYRVAFIKKGKFLQCCLPSGRCLYYYDPKLINDFTPWGEPAKKLTYLTVDGGKWVRTETYGGKLVENIIQAICRDLEAWAIVRVDLGDNPYRVVMHTHDEIVAEIEEGRGSIEEFENLISRRPKWATGFPLSAEGWRGKRYRK